MRRGVLRHVMLLALAVGFVGTTAVTMEAQEAKIGFINLQKVLLESKKGQAVLAKLQAEKEAKQKEIDAQEKKIRQMEADFEKKRSVLSDAARKERERAIRKQRRDLRRTVDDLNRDFTERERDIRDGLIKEVAAVVKSYGEKNGYLLIMEVRAGGLMYGNKAADLSEEVTAAYDATVGSGKK